MASFYYIYVKLNGFNSLLGIRVKVIASKHAVVYLHSIGYDVEISMENDFISKTSNRIKINKYFVPFTFKFMMNALTNIFKTHMMRMRQMIVNGTRIALVNNESVCLCLCIGQVKDFFNETGYISVFVHMFRKKCMLQELLIVWPIRIFLL